MSAKGIKHTHVGSSTIRSIGHDGESNTLEVRFQDGSLYSHSDVPAHKVAAMLQASSPGKYYHANVRGIHPHKKLS